MQRCVQWVAHMEGRETQFNFVKLRVSMDFMPLLLIPGKSYFMIFGIAKE